MAMQYGSLQNLVVAQSKSSIVPKIGMGATKIMWTDREAYEVIAIKDARHITVRRALNS